MPSLAVQARYSSQYSKDKSEPRRRRLGQTASWRSGCTKTFFGVGSPSETDECFNLETKAKALTSATKTE